MNQQSYAPPCTTHVSVIANRHNVIADPNSYTLFNLASHNHSSPSAVTPSEESGYMVHPHWVHNPNTTFNASEYHNSHIPHLDQTAAHFGHRLPSIPHNIPSHLLPFDPQTHPMPTYPHPTYTQATKRRTGGRRPKEEEDTHIRLSHEEKAKRDQRRQRNKEAAARCRQRRLNTLQQLQTEVDKLMREKSDCHREVEQLRHENDELRRLLRGHNCCLADNTTAKTMKMDRPMHTMHAPPVKREPEDPVLTQCTAAPTVNMDNICTMADINVFGDSVQRPHSLPLTGLTPTTPGISLQTPSRGFNSYDLLGGSTGLTPTNVSNMMVVSLPSLETPVVTTAPIIGSSSVPTTLKSL